MVAPLAAGVCDTVPHNGQSQRSQSECDASVTCLHCDGSEEGRGVMILPRARRLVKVRVRIAWIHQTSLTRSPKLFSKILQCIFVVDGVGGGFCPLVSG